MDYRGLFTPPCLRGYNLYNLRDDITLHKLAPYCLLLWLIPIAAKHGFGSEHESDGSRRRIVQNLAWLAFCKVGDEILDDDEFFSGHFVKALDYLGNRYRVNGNFALRLIVLQIGRVMNCITASTSPID